MSIVRLKSRFNSAPLHQDYQVNIRLYEKPTKTYEDYKLIGKNLTIGRDTLSELGGRWYENLDYGWNRGDTVIKHKGELNIVKK